MVTQTIQDCEAINVKISAVYKQKNLKAKITYRTIFQGLECFHQGVKLVMLLFSYDCGNCRYKYELRHLNFLCEFLQVPGNLQYQFTYAFYLPFL